MKAAFAVWEDRIAPVFDVARRIHLVEAEDGRVVGEADEALPGELPAQKVLRLAELGVGTLVCGAISRPLEAAAGAYGIRVVPFVAGDLAEVVRAWLAGRLRASVFAMPGCCRRRVRAGQGTKEAGMGNRNRGGRGGGQGVPGRGQGPGRQGGGPGGVCRCVKCGYEEPHARGVPCQQKQCPKCGAALTRK